MTIFLKRKINFPLPQIPSPFTSYYKDTNLSKYTWERTLFCQKL